LDQLNARGDTAGRVSTGKQAKSGLAAPYCAVCIAGRSSYVTAIESLPPMFAARKAVGMQHAASAGLPDSGQGRKCSESAETSRRAST